MDWGSEISDSEKTYSGSRGQKGTGSGFATLYSTHKNSSIKEVLATLNG